MKSVSGSVDTPRIAVVTLNAKAYYAFTLILNEINLSFESVSPDSDINPNVHLILTTHRERRLIKARNVLCLEDITGKDTSTKEKIFSGLFSSSEDLLLIGIDPGYRTGIISFYRGREILGRVTVSLEKTLSVLTDLIKNSQAKRKVIRIGDGDPEKTNYIASFLLEKFKEKIEIEVVNERGTSNMANTIHFKGQKDLRSARIISLRRGQWYQGDSNRYG